jgi:hypothetical protein
LGIAVVIDLGGLHRLHTSDDLVFVLASLYAWTPFFWEQDRVGLLLPLLASPCPDPLLNLLIQNALSAFAGLAATLVLSRYLFRQPFYPLVAAAANAGLIALTPADFRYNLFVNCCYGTALTLGVGGLLLTEPGRAGRVTRPRGLGALVLVALSEWVYLGNVLLLLPLAVFRCWLMPARPGGVSLRRGWRPLRTDPEFRCALAVLALGTAVGFGLKTLGTAVSGETTVGGLYAQFWPLAWGRMAGNLWEALAAGPWLVVLPVAAVAGLLCQARGDRRPLRPVYRAGAVAALAGLAKALFLGTRTWVAWNQFAFRYLIPTVLCLQVALVAVALAPLAGAVTDRGRRLLTPLSAAVVLAAALVVYGWPSPVRVRADLDDTLGAYTADVLDGDCEFVCGDYWHVWPAVYHANLTLHERGDPRTVWGIADRGRPMRRCWQTASPAERRIAVPRDDRQDADDLLAAYGFGPPAEAGARRTVEVLRAAAPLP